MLVLILLVILVIHGYRELACALKVAHGGVGRASCKVCMCVCVCTCVYVSVCI